MLETKNFYVKEFSDDDDFIEMLIIFILRIKRVL